MADEVYGFRGVATLTDALVGDQLEANFQAWLRWGLLAAGGFQTVARGTGHLGNRAKLRPVTDERDAAASGRTYRFQGNRQDWVWETGVPYAAQPVRPSGVWVNSGFVPASSTGTYAHYVNYPHGQVVFSGSVPTGTVVEVEHSFRTVQVHTAAASWFQEIVYRSQRADEGFLAPAASGGPWELLAENRVQLPAYVVDVSDKDSCVPYEVGNSSRILTRDVYVHCFAESPADRRKLKDVLGEQFGRTLPTFDRDGVAFPLDYRGALASGTQTFPALVSGAPWRHVQVKTIDSYQQQDLGRELFWSTVRLQVEIDCP